jgi:hypothetical protein
MKSKITIYLAVIGLLSVLVLIGCGDPKLNGTPIANQKPSISWSNVPLPDSVFRSNAVMSWFGKDMDGEVNGYFYYVALASAVGGDPAGYVSQLPDIQDWHETDSTVVTVQLYAPDNEQDTLPQYVFVKCIDNDGEYSNIIYRRFSRINHLPVTIIGDCPGSTEDSMSLGDVVWTLPDTTRLWRGLKVSWSGKDTIDFPNDQPDFDYEWKLYGPYDTTSATANALTLADTAGHIPMFSSYDSTLNTVWSRDKDTTFVGLQTGVYIFEVRVRDDARAADPTSAWRKFMCIEPVWVSNPGQERDVLLSQSTQYYRTAPYRGWPSRNDPPMFRDSIVAFYSTMVENAGYSITIYDTARLNTAPAPTPPVALLAKHRMLIIDDFESYKPEMNAGNNPTLSPAVRDYLNIGGRVWVIGRRSFATNNLQAEPNREDYGAQSVAYQMFNLSAATYEAFYTDTALARFTQFRSAKSLMPEFENIGVDSVKCSYLKHVGLCNVEVLERDSVYSKSLFTFGSLNPDTSIFEDLPIAVKCQPRSGIYKTAYFAFPLYFMDNSEGKVQHVFDVMLAWFLEDNTL